MLEHIEILRSWAKALEPLKIIKQRVNVGTRRLRFKWSIEKNQPTQVFIDPSVLDALGQEVPVMELKPFPNEDEVIESLSNQMRNDIDRDILKRISQRLTIQKMLR